MTGSIDHAAKVQNKSEPQYIYTKINQTLILIKKQTSPKIHYEINHHTALKKSIKEILDSVNHPLIV